VKPADVLDGKATYAVECCRAEAMCDALPNSCIDLIVTDHPYHGVKDHDWDNEHETETAFLDWTRGMVRRYQRILKTNGSLYVFASPDMGARVECVVRESMRVLTNIRWEKDAGFHKTSEKEALRSPFPASETIVFAEQFGADNMAKGEAGYGAKCDELRGFVFEPLRAYLDGERAGLSVRVVAENYQKVTGSRTVTGMAGHWFGRVQWALPTAENYTWLRALFNANGGNHLAREYEDLRREYEDLRRPFNVSAQVPYTDVWHHKTVGAYDGKHPCEKPRDMAEDIINASSRPGAVVADFFAGSGVFLAEAVRLGRRAIGCDMDPHWAAATVRKIQNPGLRSPKPARQAAKNQLPLALE
jgi:site-specific DNA-methyltransferase (adenine-specific)